MKVPNFLDGWSLFLRGLLANMQERQIGRSALAGICPVLFSTIGGWVVVMPRARVMTREEFLSFDPGAFCNRDDYSIPSEHKENSFGYLHGEVVAIDYGN